MRNPEDLFDFAAGDRYLALLHAATPEQWERFARALDPLRGDDIRAVWRRAEARLMNAEKARRLVPAVYYVTTGFIAGIELLSEFADPVDPALTAALLRRSDDEDPVRRRIGEQWADAIELAERRLPGDAVARETVQHGTSLVRAARGRLDDDLRASYGALEIVAPLERLGLDRAP